MNTVRYLGQDTDFATPALWKRCPILEILEDPSKGIIWELNGHRFGTHTSASGAYTLGTLPDYAIMASEGVTVKSLANIVGGTIEVSGNDADNDEAYIQGQGSPFAISPSTGKNPLWFEAAVKKASVGDNALALFAGLGEGGLAAAATLTDDTGEVADKNVIGFQTLQADGDALVFCWKADGQTKQTEALDTASAVLTANTYVKVGFLYDPQAPTADRILIFVDGVKQAGRLSQADLDAATFPDDICLAPLFGFIVGTAAESKGYLRWARVVQLRG